jgi:excisionase family DNA binding protein
MPGTPAELDSQAEFIVERVKEKLRRDLAQPLVVDADELAKIFKVGRDTIERKTRSGEIPSMKVGNKRRYEVQHVIDHLHRYMSTADGANLNQ